MEIYTYGQDVRLKYCASMLSANPIPFYERIILLPIPSTRNGITVSGTDESLSDITRTLLPNDALVCYELPADARKDAVERGASVVDLSHDEAFLEENAALTAVGTVGRILTEERVAPCGLNVGIIGYGRIGQHLLRLLMFMGARVRVFTTKSTLLHELQLLGISGADSLSIKDSPEESFTGLNILINTAPAEVIPEYARSALSGVRVIELASGKNIPDGITYESFPSVPKLMYPESAGAAMYNSVIRMLA
jgi:hypothetical protein